MANASCRLEWHLRMNLKDPRTTPWHINLVHSTTCRMESNAVILTESRRLQSLPRSAKQNGTFQYQCPMHCGIRFKIKCHVARGKTMRSI